MISDRDGAALVRAARRIVAAHLRGAKESGADDIPADRAGVFVTLKSGDTLRGCIGHMGADRPVGENLRDAAIAAATADPRFQAVGASELDRITFEVTVLDRPEVVSVADPAEYPSKIVIGRDGLIASRAGKTGLLLPQVPGEFGWGPVEFLDGTCQKAGLPAGAWRDGNVVIERFSGAVWSEVSPDGEIVRVEL